MTRRIATAIDIDAPADAIWRVLVDFPAYPEWNPFIRRIAGEAKVGAKLEVTAQPANRKPMTFRPTVRVADPDRELRWLGRVLLPGIFDGEHAFVIEPQAKRLPAAPRGDVQRAAGAGLRRHARRHGAVVRRAQRRAEAAGRGR